MAASRGRSWLWTALIGAAAAIIAGIVIFAAIAWEREIDPISLDASMFPEEQVARGAQLSALGNCGVCHTSEGGARYAGGYSMETPFGTIYSTNITPARQTGIGSWSEDAFIRAMREGVDREGRHLYPAFPYHFFARTTREDLAALYAYFMTREPIEAEDRENDLPFPLGFRPLLAGWKLLFHRDRPDDEALEQSASANPGAYYVDGLAHCGACHTPINFLGAPRRSRGLSGGETEGWIAPALNGEKRSPVPWTAETMLTYLRTGRHIDHSAAAGPMRPVVHSLAEAADEDVQAMAEYVGSLSPDETGTALSPELPRIYQPRRALLVAEETVSLPMGSELHVTEGSLLWAGLCASCHYLAQETVLDWPRLETATIIHLERPDNLIRVIVEGIGDDTEAPDRFMPGFRMLPDGQIEALVSHLRQEVAGIEPWDDVAASIEEIRQDLREAPDGS